MAIEGRVSAVHLCSRLEARACGGGVAQAVVEAAHGMESLVVRGGEGESGV